MGRGTPRKKSNVFVRALLTCSDCGYSITIQRNKGRIKPGGHLKAMWCPNCMKRVNFIQEPSEKWR